MRSQQIKIPLQKKGNNCLGKKKISANYSLDRGFTSKLSLKEVTSKDGPVTK
jgi:hypothetical protein